MGTTKVEQLKHLGAKIQEELYIEIEAYYHNPTRQLLLLPKWPY